MVKKIKENYPVFIIFFITFLLFLTNYKKNTFLVGWDNLFPEFDILTNLKRSIFGVWQEYRGLGLLDGMAHTANLFHTIFIFLLKLFFPLNMIRYLSIFFCYFLGGISFYFLISKLIKDKKSAFLSALFYLLNIGTIQMFFAPLEVFAFHFFSLPLITLVTINLFKKPSKKNRLFLILIFLLTSPQFFVPTIFIVFSVFFILFLFFYSWQKNNFKLGILIFFVFLITNSFWLLPYFYGLKYNSQIVPNTKINQFSSEEIFFRNKAYGDFLNVINFKGFMLSTVESDVLNNKNIYFMDAWKKHSSLTSYQIIFYFFLILGFLGVYKIIKTKDKKFYSFIFAYFFSFLFLANNTFLFTQINDLIRNKIPVLGEVFRIPFTKFITLFIFSFSIFLAEGLKLFLKKVSSNKFLFILLTSFILYLGTPAFKGEFFSNILKLEIPKDYLDALDYLQKQDENQRIALIPTPNFWNWETRSWGHRGSGFLWYGIKQPILLRAFDPWSFYNEQFYNELSYALNNFDTQTFNQVLDKYQVKYLLLDGYIINSTSPKPINYEKIINFLEKNPLLKKEGQWKKIYLFSTIKNQSWVKVFKNPAKIYLQSLFTKKDPIFEKYGNYLVDKKTPDVIYPFSSFFSEKTQNDLPFTIENSQEYFILRPKQKIVIPKNYQLKIPSIFNDYLIPVKVSLKEEKTLILTPQYPEVFVNGEKIEVDEDILTFDLEKNFYRPTIQFVDINHQMNLDEISYLQNNFLNTIKIVEGINQKIVSIDTTKITKKEFIIKINEPINDFFIKIKKIKSPLSLEKKFDINNFKIEHIKSPFDDKNSFYKIEESPLKITVKGTKVKTSFWQDNLPHQGSYLIKIESYFKSGLPLDFYVDNIYQKRPELETKLSKKNIKNYLVLPKTEDFNAGYGFNLIINSVGKEETSAILYQFEIFPFPKETLESLNFTSPLFHLSTNRIHDRTSETIDFATKKIGYFLYQISNFQISQNQFPATLYLSQSYHPGWKAYIVKHETSNVKRFLNTFFPFIFGKEIKEHVIVNNWANGFILSSNTKLLTSNTNKFNIIIIFLPQYLEFLGFLMMGVGFLIVIKIKHQESHLD